MICLCSKIIFCCKKEGARCLQVVHFSWCTSLRCERAKTKPQHQCLLIHVWKLKQLQKTETRQLLYKSKSLQQASVNYKMPTSYSLSWIKYSQDFNPPLRCQETAYQFGHTISPSSSSPPPLFHKFLSKPSIEQRYGLGLALHKWLVKPVEM